MQSTLRQIKAKILWHNTDPENIASQLEAASVPISADDCRTCANPCDQGHEEYPPRFDVDFETEMLGSVKPYNRQLIVSTGKSDWPREVTEVFGSLAHYLGPSNPGTQPLPKSASVSVHGIFNAQESSRTAILNGSHHTVSDDRSCESILVFPDYVCVSDVPASEHGATEFWDKLNDSNIKSSLEMWVLPYNSIILLCSHKRRDNRCAIAAPKLEEAFIHSFERLGWETHTQIEHPSSFLDDFTEEEKREEISKQLENVSRQTQKKALILKVSHTGGHKFAGNAVIYSPKGWCAWYGRVTTHQVDSIVQTTIVEGKIIPALLRGGVNIAKAGCNSLNDW